MAAPEKCTVYIIRSERSPARHYIGPTSDLARRLDPAFCEGFTLVEEDAPGEVHSPEGDVTQELAVNAPIAVPTGL